MNTDNTHNKKFGVIFIERLPWSGFRLIFWSLAELKLFDLNYSKRYHYPAPILKKNRRKRSHQRRYNKLFLPSRGLFIDYGYAIDFSRDSDFNEKEFWEDLYKCCTKFNYKIYRICKFSIADNQCKFSEVITMEEFYGI